jgi:hypothetical protein
MNDKELGFDRAHPARTYDYLLGGKDNYPRDREAAEAGLREWPAMRTSSRANREFMHRTARYLAAEQGITQFLDIGTGIPTEPNLHQVVQAVRPDAHVVYVDNDPIVLAHARALLIGTPEGITNYLQADLRQPQIILDSTELRDTLDLSKPVGLTLIAILHFLEDDSETMQIVRELTDALPAGSFLALSHATLDFDPEPLARVQDAYRARGVPLRLRTSAEIEEFFAGLRLIEPGVVQVHKWHPDDVELGGYSDKDIAIYGGLAQKP